MNRRISPFVTSGDVPWAKTYAAGRLLENARPSTFAANHIPATSYDDGHPALVLRERGPAGRPADICALTNTLDASFEPPAPEYDVEVGWHHVDSALAWIDTMGSETLLVGYRQRDRDGAGTVAADSSSLWRCDMSRGTVPECVDCEFGVECYPIEGGIGIDVSDIEVTQYGHLVGGGLMGIWAFDTLSDTGFDGRGVDDTGITGINDDTLLGEFSMFDRADYSGASTFQGTVDNAMAAAFGMSARGTISSRRCRCTGPV